MEKVIQKEEQLLVVEVKSQQIGNLQLQLMADGLVNAEALVTKIYDISEMGQAYRRLKSGEGIKALRPLGTMKMKERVDIWSHQC